MRPDFDLPPTLPRIDWAKDVHDVGGPAPAPAAGATALEQAASDADAKILGLDQKWYFEGDAGRFWVLTKDKQWVRLDRKTFELHLRAEGFSDKKKKGSPLSEVEAETHQTVLYKQVSYAGPLAGWQVGLVQFADTKALITRSPSLPEPKDPGTCEFPAIDGFLYSLLVGQDIEGNWIDQRPYFLAWLKHALQSLYAGVPTRGLCLVLAGEAGSGKTLLKELIRVAFGGRECLPYDYMLGRDNFNRELSEAPLWVVDDVAAGTKAEDRVKFGAEIKKVVANTSIKIRGIQQNGMILNPFRRLVVCVNNEPDRLLVLPAIDDDLSDKIMIFKGYRGRMPMPLSSEEQKRAFWAALMRELPGWIWSVLNAYDDPAISRGRFGVVAYQHPEILQDLSDIAPETRVLEWLGLWFGSRAGTSTWTASCADWRAALAAEDCPISAHDKTKLPEPAWLGKRLAKLQRRYPRRFFPRRTSKGNVWEIHREDVVQSGGTEAP